MMVHAAMLKRYYDWFIAAADKPYATWLANTQFILEDLPGGTAPSQEPSKETLLDRQQAFGYTQEDLDGFLDPMARGHRDAAILVSAPARCQRGDSSAF